MTAGRLRRLLPFAAACLLLTSCADFTVVLETPPPTPGPTLPPIGFNHRFGNTPLSSEDGFALERQMFGQNVFWEVALRIEPEQNGYVKLGNFPAAKAARHSITSMLLVIATEDGHTIVGLLAWPGGDQGQEQYCIALLNRVRAFGYDNLQSAQVNVYFTEADEHAQLSWSRSTGYTYRVFDNDLKGTYLRPLPSTTPIPTPAIPATESPEPAPA
jgi:hypothetical protein